WRGKDWNESARRCTLRQASPGATDDPCRERLWREKRARNADWYRFRQASPGATDDPSRERLWGQKTAMRREESRRGRQECLRHVSGADHQQLSGCFLENGDAASKSACGTSGQRWLG